MKALMWTDGKKVELKDIPEPQVQPGTAKIQINYAALCATDVHIVDHGLYGLKPPMPLGHECCGTIVELGEGMTELGWKIGDRVAVSSVASCGVCDDCKRGDDIFCRNLYAVPRFTEYAVLKPLMMFKIPDHIKDLAPYALAEPCASAMRGIDLADIKIGDNVAISGTGGIGSILLNMILLKGSTRVTVIEPVAAKRELALKMGADYAIDPFNEDVVARAKEITDGRGYDVVFEASGVPAAAPPILEIIANKGTAVYFAVFPMEYELPVNLYKLYSKEGRIQTVYTTNYNYPRVIELIPKLQMDKIIGTILPLDEGAKAWDLFHQSIYPKIVLKCSE